MSNKTFPHGRNRRKTFMSNRMAKPFNGIPLSIDSTRPKKGGYSKLTKKGVLE